MSAQRMARSQTAVCLVVRARRATHAGAYTSNLFPGACTAPAQFLPMECVQDKQGRLGWTVNSPREFWQSSTGMDICQNMLPAMHWLALIAFSTEAYVLLYKGSRSCSITKLVCWTG
jgi:hypothetical protein